MATTHTSRLLRAGLLAAGALGVAAATARGLGRQADDRLFKWANTRVQGPGLDRFFKGVTELGALWASAGAAGALALRGRRRAAGNALAAAGATWLLGQGMKKAFGRARPYDAGASRLLIGKPQGTSWPSSHPMVLLAFVTVAARDLGLGPGARSALTGLAGTVAASRVYLGVHYPSDVAGGLLLGRAAAEVWTAAVSRPREEP